MGDCKNCTLCRLNQVYVLGHTPSDNEIVAPVNRRTPSSSTTTTAKTARIMLPTHHSSAPILTSSSDIGRDRTLRSVTILAWLPAFPFLLAHGIVSEDLCPVLGIIPMTFSALVGAVHLHGQANKNRNANILTDAFVAAFLIGILIPGWVELSGGHGRWDHNVTMVGTYGTVPMMLNFIIHVYFVLREFQLNPFKASHCPHCHGDLKQNKPGRAMSEHSHDSKESYLPVTMQDAEVESGGPASYNDHDYNAARPSTDDEAARLV